MTRFASWLAIFMLAFVTSVTAQNNADQKFFQCLRDVGNNVLPYTTFDTYGAVGSYRFTVNSMYEAGVCQGRAPYYTSYDWTLCNFRGPPAVYNKVYGAKDLLSRPDLQDKLVEQLVIKRSVDNKELLLTNALQPIKGFQNASDVFGALLYRKGAAAVKLLALADINSADRLGYTTRDYVRFYADCAGNNTSNATRRALFTETPDTTGQQTAASQAQRIAWLKLSDMPADIKEKVLSKVPELRLVFGPQEQHGYINFILGDDRTQSVLVGLTGPDFCKGKQCTYYLFRNNFANVVIFYAGQVMMAPGQNGFYIDGFYKPVGELKL
jgi:hypothetical protein